MIKKLGRFTIIATFLFISNIALHGMNSSSDNSKLHKAAREQDNAAEINRLIQEEHCNVNEQTPKYRETPLHHAVGHDHLENVKALLENKADPNIANNTNKTPLFLAINDKKNGPAIFQILLDAGADTTKQYAYASNKVGTIAEMLQDSAEFPTDPQELQKIKNMVTQYQAILQKNGYCHQSIIAHQFIIGTGIAAICLATGYWIYTKWIKKTDKNNQKPVVKSA